MKNQVKALSLVIGTGLALASTAALAEQTIGVQAAGGAAAIATARVNVRVIVPKVVILRVGNADGTVSDVNFTAGLNPAVTGTPGNSLAYAGTIPPGFSTSVATTNPTSTAGSLTVGAWTNVAGTLLSCSLSALTGATPFATGATTTAGVPGTSAITVTSISGAANLQAPGTSGTGTLADCGTLTSTIAALTTLGGTFTYSTSLAAGSLAAGTYGNTVTYTATTL